MISCYVMHPYWSPDEVTRTTNVQRARELARVCLRRGFSVFAPLQMSIGIEDSVGEKQWLQLGLYWIKKCDIAVRPERYWLDSEGCRAESIAAEQHGVEIYEALWLKDENTWELPTEMSLPLPRG